MANWRLFSLVSDTYRGRFGFCGACRWFCRLPGGWTALVVRLCPGSALLDRGVEAELAEPLHWRAREEHRTVSAVARNALRRYVAS